MGIDKCISAERNDILVKQRLKRLAEPEGVAFDWHVVEMEDQQENRHGHARVAMLDETALSSSVSYKKLRRPQKKLNANSAACGNRWINPKARQPAPRREWRARPWIPENMTQERIKTSNFLQISVLINMSSLIV